MAHRGDFHFEGDWSQQEIQQFEENIESDLGPNDRSDRGWLCTCYELTHGKVFMANDMGTSKVLVAKSAGGLAEAIEGYL